MLVDISITVHGSIKTGFTIVPYIRAHAQIASDWTNLSFCGNILAAVLAWIFLWIAADVENYVQTPKPSFIDLANPGLRLPRLTIHNVCYQPDKGDRNFSRPDNSGGNSNRSLSLPKKECIHTRNPTSIRLDTASTLRIKGHSSKGNATSQSDTPLELKFSEIL